MDAKAIYSESIRHFLSPVLPLLDDPDVSEIMINGYDTVYFEKRGRLTLSKMKFPNPSMLLAAATNIAEYCNRRIGGNFILRLRLSCKARSKEKFQRLPIFSDKEYGIIPIGRSRFVDSAQ